MPLRPLVALILSVTFALPVMGQYAPRFEIWPTQDCVVRGLELTERRNCIGAAAQLCMESSEIGHTTLGMTMCTEQELAWWDAELNRFYQEARAVERAEDAEMAGATGYQSQAEALREMQRAWITFRDAKCDYERAQWGGGTGGGPAWLSCLMYETAEQALYLQVMSVAY